MAQHRSSRDRLPGGKVSIKLPKINPAEWKKFGAAVVALIGEALSVGLLNGTAKDWAVIIVGALGAVGVGAVTNAKPVTPTA